MRRDFRHGAFLPLKSIPSNEVLELCINPVEGLFTFQLVQRLFRSPQEHRSLKLQAHVMCADRCWILNYVISRSCGLQIQLQVTLWLVAFQQEKCLKCECLRNRHKCKPLKNFIWTHRLRICMTLRSTKIRKHLNIRSKDVHMFMLERMEITVAQNNTVQYKYNAYFSS